MGTRSKRRKKAKVSMSMSLTVVVVNGGWRKDLLEIPADFTETILVANIVQRDMGVLLRPQDAIPNDYLILHLHHHPSSIIHHPKKAFKRSASCLLSSVSLQSFLQ